MKDKLTNIPERVDEIIKNKDFVTFFKEQFIRKGFGKFYQNLSPENFIKKIEEQNPNKFNEMILYQYKEYKKQLDTTVHTVIKNYQAIIDKYNKSEK